MKILFVSPLGFAINARSKYAGIEQLVWNYSRELVKEHDVTVMGRSDSVYSEGVEVLPYTPQPKDDLFLLTELNHFQQYQGLLRDFDVIHDFSHQHLIARYMVNLPTLNIFWHAPALAQYPKAPYNIIALSKWASREFKRYYNQNARYQQSIALDVKTYKPSERHGDRFLTLGRMSEEKGNLNAIMLCKRVGVPLDVVGGRGTEKAGTDLSDYEKQIQENCDGEQIKFLGEVTDQQKIELMQSCRALLYVTDHPEVTSHKIQEAMLCGAPVVVPNLGALPEIVTNGVDGFLCNNEVEFMLAMEKIDALKPEKTYEKIKQTYSVESVCKEYVKLYKEVAGGLRW